MDVEQASGTAEVHDDQLIGDLLQGLRGAPADFAAVLHDEPGDGGSGVDSDGAVQDAAVAVGGQGPFRSPVVAWSTVGDGAHPGFQHRDRHLFRGVGEGGLEVAELLHARCGAFGDVVQIVPRSASSRSSLRSGDRATDGSRATNTEAVPIVELMEVERANRPMNWIIALRLFCTSCSVAIFRAGRSNPSPSMSTQTTIRHDWSSRVANAARRSLVATFSCRTVGFSSGARD